MHFIPARPSLDLGDLLTFAANFDSGTVRLNRFYTFAVGSPGKEPRDLECKKISMEKFTMNPTGSPKLEI